MLSGRMCDSNEEIETATRIVSPVKSLRHEDETSCSSGLADQILRTDFFHEHTRHFVKHIETVNSGQDNVLIDDLLCATLCPFSSWYLIGHTWVHPHFISMSTRKYHLKSYCSCTPPWPDKPKSVQTIKFFESFNNLSIPLKLINPSHRIINQRMMPL